ncbi:hypothetical protein ACFLZX_06070 [Nanoarchaeota archaeon]
MDFSKLVKFAPLIVILLVFAYIGNNYYFSGTSDQEYPRTYLAGDTYWDQLRIDHVQMEGSYNQQAKVLLGFHPFPFTTADGPILYYTTNWLVNLLNVESHVAIHILHLFALFLEVSLIFIILLRINRLWAWLSLPVMIIALQFPFIAGINWGLWKSYYSYFIFFFLLYFYPFEFDRKVIAGYIIAFGALLLTQPFMAPYALILLIFSIFSKGGKVFDNVKKIAIIGVATTLMFIEYAFRYFATNLKPDGGGNVAQLFGIAEYSLFGANSSYTHFGFWFWISLVGFVIGFFYLVQNLDKIKEYKFQALTVLLFVFVLYNLNFIVQRFMQFRFTWPIFIGVFIGFLFYNIIRLLPKNIPRDVVGIAGFIILLLIVFQPGDFPETTHSIISPDLFKSQMYIKDNTPEDTTVLLVDPNVDQVKSTLINWRHIRFVDRVDFLTLPNLGYDLSNVTTKRACQIPPYLKQGFSLKENVWTDNLCLDKKVELCQNDYIILHMAFRDQGQADIMKTLVEKLSTDEFETVFSTKTTAVIKNKNKCGTWIPEYKV